MRAAYLRALPSHFEFLDYVAEPSERYNGIAAIAQRVRVRWFDLERESVHMAGSHGSWTGPSLPSKRWCH